MSDQAHSVRQRIIDGCIPLFIARGFKGLTMDYVARELHISKRTIYEIFHDKATLIAESCKTAADRDRDALNRIIESDETSTNKLLAFAKYLEECAISSEHIDELLEHYEAGYREFRRIYEQRVAAARAIYVEGVQAGVFIDACPSLGDVKDVSTPQEVSTVVAFLLSAIVRFELTHLSTLDAVPSHVVEHALHMVTNAFMTPEARASQS